VETCLDTPQRQLEIVLNTDLTDSSNPLELLDILYAQVVKSSPKPSEALKWLKAYRMSDVGNFGPTTAWFWCRLCELSEGEADFLLENLSALLRLPNLDDPYDASIVFYHKSFQDFLSGPCRYKSRFPELSDKMVEDWLVQRFDFALRCMFFPDVGTTNTRLTTKLFLAAVDGAPQVRLKDPYFHNVFRAIIPSYWRAAAVRTRDGKNIVQKIEEACAMIDKEPTLELPASGGLETDVVILCVFLCVVVTQ
jgi:hypothetical protein